MIVNLDILTYYTAICGLLAIMAPILTGMIPWLIFGSVLGLVASTTWPAIALLLK